MQFEFSEEIYAPIEHVFATLSRFSEFESQARQRGVKIQRTDDAATYGVGSTWDITAKYHGRKRDFTLTLKEFATPQKMRFLTHSPAVESDLTIHLTALAEDETQVDVDATLKPKTLAARLMLQSLKLAKGRIRRNLTKRVATFVREIEGSYEQQV